MNKIDYSIYGDLLGTKFKFGGRTIKEGLDCLGLMYIMCDILEIPLPHQPSVIDRKLRSAAFEKGKEMFVEIDKAEPGCFVCFRMAGIASHIGMMIDNIRFIHVMRSKTVCIEKVNSLVWRDRLEGFYKFGKEKNE